MIDAIIIIILIAIISLIVLFLVRAKKRGEKCIGCPYARECSKKCRIQNEEKK